MFTSTREWDQAIAGVAICENGKKRVLYDIDEMVKILVDRGIPDTVAREGLNGYFAAVHDNPSAPLMFERATPAEAWAAIDKQQENDNGHTDRTGASDEAGSSGDDEPVECE